MIVHFNLEITDRRLQSSLCEIDKRSEMVPCEGPSAPDAFMSEETKGSRYS